MIATNPHAAGIDSPHGVCCHGEHPPTPEHPTPYGPDFEARTFHPRNVSRLIGNPTFGGLWHCPEHYDCPTCPRDSGPRAYTDKAWRLVDTWNGGTNEPREVWRGIRIDDAMLWVHRHTSFSYSEAIAHQGYRLEPIR